MAEGGDTRDTGSIPGLGRSPVEGNGNPLQYLCLGNPMDRGAAWATVHGVAHSWTRLSDWTIKEKRKVAKDQSTQERLSQWVESLTSSTES